MRWNPFRRSAYADTADSSFEQTVVNDAAGARLRDPRQMTNSPPGTSPDDPPSIGHIGRYALKAILGQGGLGTVYAAWDPLLSRTVAVKTLHLNADSAARPSLDALFLNEARVAAGLSHPHIVTVFDAGPAETGIYIAMERLQGQDLRHLLHQGVRLSPLEAANVVRKVAEALAYAHHKGVVHCDIKPANIFMIGRMHPKVLDFGIARLAHRETIPALDSAVAGSPYYVAPEQLDGHPVDLRSDVYSLGVVLYELLTGKKPFEGKSLEEIANAVKYSMVTPAHRLSASVPQQLSIIASHAMARDPAQRYSSARRLALMLRQWLNSAEARALSGDPLNGRGLGTRLNPSSIAPSLAARSTVGTLTVLAVGAALWWLDQAVTAPPARDAISMQAAPAAGAYHTPVEGEHDNDTLTLAATPTPHFDQIRTPPPTEQASNQATFSLIKSDTQPKPKDKPSPTAAAAETSALAASMAASQASPPAMLMTGIVQFAVSPWGHIDVDGQVQGTSPPLTRLTLNAGAHTITVRNADFPSYVENLVVSPDNPVMLRHRFGP